MQFTTVASITGTATATGSAQYSLPVNVPFRPATNGASIAAFPPVPTWNLSSSISGGPAFSVPVLDTQEFYQGIMKPIPGAMYDLYVQASYPRELLFNLFVQSVTMRRVDDKECPGNDHTSSCEFEFQNNVNDDLKINLFQELGHYLDWLGLTTRPAPPEGVAFTNPHNVNIRYIGAPLPGDDNKAQVVAPPGGAAAASDSPPKQYGFCFEPRTPEASSCVEGPYSPSVCGQKVELELPKDLSYKLPKDREAVLQKIKHAREEIGRFHGSVVRLKKLYDDEHTGLHQACNLSRWLTQKDKLAVKADAKKGQVVPPAAEPDDAAVNRFKAQRLNEVNANFNAAGAPEARIMLSEKFVARLRGTFDRDASKPDEPKRPNPFDHFKGNDEVILTFKVRSVEQMIYYIGEVARRQVAPDSGESRQIELQELPGKRPQKLFILREGSPEPGDFLSVNYEGRWYSVPSKSNADFIDLSAQVLSVLRQQVALNSSAKSLPQSSVITVVGQ
jgi:hypothetical protein